ncbi:19169_t:CDS:2 [Gigaspora rosea]|nr:19169_t:CDS:2 [Gigaspora rosea]
MQIDCASYQRSGSYHRELGVTSNPKLNILIITIPRLQSSFNKIMASLYEEVKNDIVAVKQHFRKVRSTATNLHESYPSFTSDITQSVWSETLNIVAINQEEAMVNMDDID